LNDRYGGVDWSRSHGGGYRRWLENSSRTFPSFCRAKLWPCSAELALHCATVRAFDHSEFTRTRAMDATLSILRYSPEPDSQAHLRLHGLVQPHMQTKQAHGQSTAHFRRRSVCAGTNVREHEAPCTAIRPTHCCGVLDRLRATVQMTRGQPTRTMQTMHNVMCTHSCVALLVQMTRS
jgi:hypothetical protein